MSSSETQPQSKPIGEANSSQELAKPSLSLPLRLKNYLAKGGQALHHRNYRLFWGGQLVSLIGTWMQNLAQSWLVLTLSNNNPLALGLVAALQFLPTTILSLFTGVVADRYSKHKLLIITQTCAMVVAIVLGTLTVGGWVQLWQVYLCAFCLGTVNAFDMPTRQSFVSEMVGKPDLMNAVALNSTIFNAARLVGPALAGLLIGLGERIFSSTLAGIALAVWLNAFSYVAVLTGLLRMQPDELFRDANKPPNASVMNSLKEGLSYIRNTPSVLSLIIIVGMMGTFGFNFNVWIPVLARERLNVGAEGYGLLMAGLGGGALVSAITMTLSGRKPVLNRIMIALLCFSVFEASVALSGFYPLSLIFMIGAGLSMIRVGAASNTLVQMTTPDHLRGRVMSVYLLVFAGTAPFGSLLMGWLGSIAGISFSMLVGALLTATAVPLVWLYKRQLAVKTSGII